MVTRIFYDTEFIDNGVEITPLAIAMRRLTDGAELYAVTDDLSAMARAAEHHWLRENVLKWLPVHVEWSGLVPGGLGVKVEWDDEHPDYDKVHPLEEIGEMVEDFVLARANPELWAYYASYDHVLYAQLFGPMAELPTGMPMFTMDLKHECVMHGDPKMPALPAELVDTRWNGERREHYAPYDVDEEVWRFEWLREKYVRRGSRLMPDA